MTRPMLAAKFDEMRTALHLKEDKFLYIQPKIDGMRVLFDRGVAYSRSWKPWTNKYLQEFAKVFNVSTHGWDGEMLPGIHEGDTIHPDVFRQAMSDLRSMDGTKEFTYYLFDLWDSRTTTEHPYYIRKSILGCSPFKLWEVNTYQFKVLVKRCPTFEVRSLAEINLYEEKFLEQGFEGAILRRKDGMYKNGRATPKGGELTKLKRFEDDEAIIVGYEVAYENKNEAITNELGLTSRSAHQDNLVPKDYLGSFTVELLKDRSKRFNIGVMKGFTQDDRRSLWNQREQLLGKIVKFKHQGYAGGYDLPRTPVLDSFRDPIDL